MSWSFISVDSGGDPEGGGNSQVTVSPTGIQDDDVIILGACADEVGTITFPGAFTAPASLNITTADGRLAAAYKVAASESGGYLVTLSNSFDFVVFGMVWRGGDPADIFDVSTERTNSGTGHIADGVNTAAANALLVAIYGSDHPGGTSITWLPPSGMDERADLNVGSWASISVHTVIQASAGASGDKTATPDNSTNGQAFLIALNEGLAGPGAGWEKRTSPIHMLMPWMNQPHQFPE